MRPQDVLPPSPPSPTEIDSVPYRGRKLDLETAFGCNSEDIRSFDLARHVFCISSRSSSSPLFVIAARAPDARNAPLAFILHYIFCFLYFRFLRFLDACHFLVHGFGSVPCCLGHIIAARAMAPDSSRNFGEQDFVTSHKPWFLQFSDFVKKIKFCLA